MKFTPPDPKTVDQSFDQALDTPMFGFNGQTYVLSYNHNAFSLHVWRIYDKGFNPDFYVTMDFPIDLKYYKDIFALSRIYKSCPDYSDHIPFWQFLSIAMGPKLNSDRERET